MTRYTLPVVNKTGLPPVEDLSTEVEQMFATLLDKIKNKDDNNILDLMETSSAYYTRAAEINARIHRLERELRIKRGDGLYKFRTGELADFMDACKRGIDLGSRRLTVKQYEHDSAARGLGGWGGGSS